MMISLRKKFVGVFVALVLALAFILAPAMVPDVYACEGELGCELSIDDIHVERTEQSARRVFEELFGVDTAVPHGFNEVPSVTISLRELHNVDILGLIRNENTLVIVVCDETGEVAREIALVVTVTDEAGNRVYGFDFETFFSVARTREAGNFQMDTRCSHGVTLVTTYSIHDRSQWLQWCVVETWRAVLCGHCGITIQGPTLISTSGHSIAIPCW